MSISGIDEWNTNSNYKKKQMKQILFKGQKKWVKKAGQRWILQSKQPEQPEQQDLQEQKSDHVQTELKWDEKEIKSEEKEQKSEQKEPKFVLKKTTGVFEEILIGEWLRSKDYPFSVDKIFANKNIRTLSDFGNIDDDQLDEILNSLQIYDVIQKTQLISDIMSNVLIFKYGMSSYPNHNIADEADEEKAVILSNDGKFDIELRYLGLHKVVILDYLYHKRILLNPKVYIQQNGQQYSAQISIFLPDLVDKYTKTVELTGFSVGKDEICAEYYAYKNLYDKLVVNQIWIHQTVFKGLIQKYQINSRPMVQKKDKLWLYFYGFRRYRHGTEYEKAEYFFYKNYEDALGQKDKYIKVWYMKQLLWYDGFYYLFADDIESSTYIYNMIVNENKDLIFLWMKSYNSRREFYGNIMQHGLLQALDRLKIHQ